MLDGLFIVAQQVAILFVLMGVGAVCRKTGLLGEKSLKGLVDLLILVVTPCLIVHVFTEQRFEPKLLAGLGWAFALSAAAIFLGILTALLAVRDRDVRTRSVLRCGIVFSNAGFMGIPLEHAILGPDGVFFGVAYVVTFNLVYWTWGLVQFCGSLKDVRPATLFLNPGTIGLAIGLPLFLLSAKLPAVVATPVKMLADLNTPVAMIVIGANMAVAKFGPVLRRPSAWSAGALRLLAVPAAFLALVWALRSSGVSLDAKMATAVAIAASAPCAALTSMFAVRYGRDVDLSAGLVSGTTLVSILTMPPIVAFAMWLFGL